jgi:hypothetical protein
MPALFFCGLVLWLGYLGCPATGYWDSLYFFRIWKISIFYILKKLLKNFFLKSLIKIRFAVESTLRRIEPEESEKPLNFIF